MQSETLDLFVYDGAIEWPGAIVALAAIACLLVWLAVRERGVTGYGLGAVFLTLRLGAIGLVLWMLLGPTHISNQRTTLLRETALLLDVSESMQAPAALGVADNLRWRYAAGVSSGATARMLAVADKAAAAVWFAERNLAAAADAWQSLAAEELAGPPLAAARRAIDEAVGRLDEIAKTRTDPPISRLAKQIAEELRRQGMPAIAAAQARLTASQSRPDLVVEAMRRLQEDAAQWRRRADSLQRAVAAAIQDHPEAPYSGAAELSRYELAKLTLERVEQDIRNHLEAPIALRRVVVDRSARVLANGGSWDEGRRVANDAATTNLAAPWSLLRDDSRGDSLGSAILLSDGSHNEVTASSPVALTGGLGAPVFTFALANGRPQRDLSIYRVNAPQTTALHDQIVVEAIITGEQAGGENAIVELLSEGEVVERREVRFTGDRQDQRVKLTVPAEELGRHEYELTVSALPHETSVKNNSVSFAVRTVRDLIRVVIADHSPRWEFRYLDQLWRRDPRVECDRLLKHPVFQATGGLARWRGLPRSVEGWSRYDVAVLGDLGPADLDPRQQAALAEWVRDRGGTVIAIAGHRSMPGSYAPGPLLSLLPTERRRQGLQTEQGFVALMNANSSELDPVMLADNAYDSAGLWSKQYRSQPIYKLSRWTRPKPSAQAMLLAAPKRWAGDANTPTRDSPALLTWHSVGSGRVVFIAAPVTWRLRYRQGDKLHHRFWGQMLRWLTEPLRGAGDSELFVGLSSSLVEFGERVEATVTIAPNRLIGGSAGLSLAAVSDAGDPVLVDLNPNPRVPGRFTAAFERLPPGTYRVRVEGLPTRGEEDKESAVVTVTQPRRRELTELAGNRPLLREIAAVSGGRELPPTAIGEAIRLTASAPRVIEESTLTPLWNRWRFFWIILGCLATEWSIRRWIGLI